MHSILFLFGFGKSYEKKNILLLLLHNSVLLCVGVLHEIPAKSIKVGGCKRTACEKVQELLLV